MEQPFVLFVMGICGSGKSTVAQRLADALRIQMLDADDFHPPANVEKMKAGKPLNDDDRAGWLDRLNIELRERSRNGESVALACSALKQRYRDVLEDGLPQFRWVYLKGDRELIVERMAQRKDHFMPTGLIDSQLEALEEPEGAIVGDIRLSVDALVESVLVEL